jgi:hypothetical protein
MAEKAPFLDKNKTASCPEIVHDAVLFLLKNR